VRRAVTTKIAIADVVGENQDDIGSRGGLSGGKRCGGDGRTDCENKAEKVFHS